MAAIAAASTSNQASAVDEAVRERRRRQVEQARTEAASGMVAGADAPQDAGTVQDVAAEPTRQDVESVRVHLPDDRIVDFGPPPGVSLTMRMMSGFAHMTMSAQAETRIKALMCVRAIDGIKARPVISMLEAQQAANDLGDMAVDLLTETFMQMWPPARISDLRIIEKKMRGT